MKSYVFNFSSSGMNGDIIDYDYSTASLLWEELDALNETAEHSRIDLTETASGSLILSVELDETRTLPALLEKIHVTREIERIADEYGGFELPSRFLFGERALNEIRSAI